MGLDYFYLVATSVPIIALLLVLLAYFFYVKDEELLEPFFRKLRVRQVEKNLPKDRDNIVDVGCGNMQFLNKVRFKKKIGVDRCLPYVYNVNALEGMAKISSNSVSCVTFIASLEHFESKKSEILVKESHRILNRRGKLIMTIPTKRSKIIIDALAFFGLISNDLVDEHHYFTKEWIVFALRDAGFDKISYKTFEIGLNSIVVAEKTK